MDSLEYKLDVLNIAPITDKIYHSELKHQQLKGMDVSQFKYYKMYGDTAMLYTAEYLNNNTLNELKQSDEDNKEKFCPSLMKRILMKISLIKFNFYLLFKKYF